MKQIIFFLSLIVASVATAVASDNVTLTISNIKGETGNLIIGVYNSSDDFPIEGRQYKEIVVPVTSSVVTKTITLPAGEYAFAICHDKDKNGTCNQNGLGIPTEGFGFSKNYRPKFRAPSFKDVKVSVGGKAQNMSIKLLYF